MWCVGPWSFSKTKELLCRVAARIEDRFCSVLWGESSSSAGGNLSTRTLAVFQRSFMH